VDYLRVHGQTSLLTLVRHMTEKIRIIVTLIALLELAKNKVISLLPVEGSDDILIRAVRTTSGSTSPVGT
jgi:chromatin segregation and condensation protein Rec8/ScpA/Scc1 (kleisin family)